MTRAAVTRAVVGRARGFTLLEVLVALVVLGFLLAALTQGVRFGLQAWGMQTRQMARQADMDATYRALGRLIADVDPGDANGNGTVQGQAHTLVLRTRLPAAAGALSDMENDVALGVDAQHRLVLRAVPHPNAELLGTPPAPLTATLLTGVDHVDFSYFLAAGKGAGWRTAWKAADLPALIRVRVAFEGGDKQKQWPDLVAAPVRTRQED